MKIAIDLSHVFNSTSNDVDNAYILKTMLDALIRINLVYIRRYHPKPLYESGVVYGRTVVWDPIPALYRRGYGDCKSLSCALIAEYLTQGIAAKPVFRFRNRQDGGKDFHILVLTDKGHEDPSAKLGMLTYRGNTCDNR
jgi:hypothetical protein